MLKRSVIGLFVSLLSLNAAAQLQWEKVILPATFTKVIDVTVSPRSIIFAVNHETDRLYRSFDEGSTWDTVIQPISGAIHAIDSNGMLYRLWGDTLWVSSNDGTSWYTEVLPYKYPQFLLASKDTLFMFTYAPYVWRSTDRGHTWVNQEFHSNGSDLNWVGCEISPRGNVFGFLKFDGSVRLISGEDGPYLVETKLGRHMILDNDPISWMMFDQTGYGYGEHNGMLIRSADEGLHWTVLDSVFDEGKLHTYWGPYGALAGNGIIAVTDTETVVSYDNGSSWTSIGAGAPTGYWKTFSTSARGTIFLESDSGLFRTRYFSAVKPQRQEHPLYTITFEETSKTLSLKKIVRNGEKAELIVMDILGRIVVRNLITEDEYRLDLSILSSGTYTASIIQNAARTSTTFSIRR